LQKSTRNCNSDLQEAKKRTQQFLNNFLLSYLFTVCV